MSLTFLRNSIINQVENSLRGTASATLAAYDQNSGTYLVAENGDVWKGGYNISNSEKLLDTIKEKSGMDVTFFYGNKRIMTSIKEQSGERILGSPAGSKIEEMVLQNGKEYFSKNVSVDGVMYFGYYVPVFQGDDSNEPVGMVFAGINKNETLYHHRRPRLRGKRLGRRARQRHHIRASRPRHRHRKPFGNKHRHQRQQRRRPI